MEQASGLTGVHASFADLLESGLEALTPTTPRTADDKDEPFVDTPRSVFSTAKYCRVVAADGLHVTLDDDPASQSVGKLAHGEVVDVLQVRNWSPENGGAVEPRFRVKKGWVSAFDDCGEPNLERMQVAMQEVRSRTWSEQKSQPTRRRGRSGPGPTLSAVSDDDTMRSSSLTELTSNSLPDDSPGTSVGTSPDAIDLEGRGPPMLMGEWDAASAPCYAVPVPPPGSLTSPLPVQVRAFAGLTSRRCGILHPGEVIQVVETRMVDGATRARFRGGWVTLLDKPRIDKGSGTAVTREPLLEWTRVPATKISSFRDPQLLASLADRVRQERLAEQQRKRQAHQELATAVLADGSGNQTGAGTELHSSGRPLSGDATTKPDRPPIILTGVEPEQIGEALALGNKMTDTDEQNGLGGEQSSSRQMLAELYAGKGGPVDIRMIGAPRTPRSATTGAPAFRSFTFHVVERVSNGRSIATFTQRYSRAKTVHEEMQAMGIDLCGCEFPAAHPLRDMVDDEENVAKRGTRLEQYYQGLFDLHWNNGTPRSVKLLKEMLGTEQILPTPERSDEFVASRASQFFKHLETMHQAFQSYTAREARATVAPEHVLDLLAEMGIEFGPANDIAAQVARDRAVEILGGAGWAAIEAWYQNPVERARRERAKAESNGLSLSPRRQQQVDGSNSIDNDDDEIAALNDAVGNRPSIGSMLMQSVKETLAEPVASQLVGADAPSSQWELEEDEDLNSELQLMHATDTNRQQRAIALGLLADATWEAIAEAEAAASRKVDAQERPDGNVPANRQLATRSPEAQSDDEDEFHDVENANLVSPQ